MFRSRSTDLPVSVPSGGIEMRIRGAVLALSALAFAATPVMAQEVIEQAASAEETAAAVAAIDQMDCELPPGGVVEKESDNLFEIDDAVCDFGQYDIKLDGMYNITSVTYDGPADNGAEGVIVDAVLGEEIEQWLGVIGCQVEEDEIEMESETLFEIDDGECAFGQFDIKLGREGGQILIRSMTRD